MSKRCTNPKMMAHPEQCKGICEQCDDYKEWAATCPDCGHLIGEHSNVGCHYRYGAYGNSGYCTCRKSYPADVRDAIADLQPVKHCTYNGQHGNWVCNVPDSCRGCFFNKQPTPTMPLAKCAKGFTIRCSICEEIKPDDDGRCVYLQTQQAHDSEVAKQYGERMKSEYARFSEELESTAQKYFKEGQLQSKDHDAIVAKQAVKEFAEKVDNLFLSKATPSFDSLKDPTKTDKWIITKQDWNEIVRAMAEGKEPQQCLNQKDS